MSADNDESEVGISEHKPENNENKEKPRKSKFWFWVSRIAEIVTIIGVVGLIIGFVSLRQQLLDAPKFDVLLNVISNIATGVADVVSPEEGRAIEESFETAGVPRPNQTNTTDREDYLSTPSQTEAFILTSEPSFEVGGQQAPHSPSKTTSPPTNTTQPPPTHTLIVLITQGLLTIKPGVGGDGWKPDPGEEGSYILVAMTNASNVTLKNITVKDASGEAPSSWPNMVPGKEVTQNTQVFLSSTEDFIIKFTEVGEDATGNLYLCFD